MFEQVQQAEARAKNSQTASEVAAQANSSGGSSSGGKTGATAPHSMPPANSNGTISR
ncbi:MAG: hypothetical protein ACRCR4_06420 [Thiotrichaceae bacterium]